MTIPNPTRDHLASQHRLEQRATTVLHSHGTDTRVRALTKAAEHLKGCVDLVEVELTDEEVEILALIFEELAREIDIDLPESAATTAAVRLAHLVSGDAS